ncbi:hypothetical protein [Neorhizobium sp. NCHU2750]|uniref:hypothetical protein n=1 Tax=Neorhizobium sp. NCHU2750 TaxID=1825976 RepID=UPI0013C3FE7A
MMDELNDTATQFRDLIMRTQKSSLPITLQDFPKGACGDTTLLLGHHLAELGHGDFRYYLGWRDGRSHAWLQSGSVIVDITADQFEDFDDPVFVSDRSSWHEEFAGTDQHAANLAVFGEATEAMLRSAYEAILDSGK